MVETVQTVNAIRHLTTSTPTARSKAKYSEVLLEAIGRRADEIGMKVNCAKTQLLMISPPNGYKNTAVIKSGDEEITSESSLKLLGFVFGTEPNVNMHVKEIQRKFRARFWALIHLRRSGFKGKELFELYSIFVRPVIEFCCTVYHSLLTAAQTSILERMQKQVVKLAYGWDTSYLELCETNNIRTLE